jgi:gas vesicle protein
MEDNSGNGFGYFLLGLGVGVAAGILLAPKAGDETREMIRSKAGEGADYLRARANESADYVKRRGAEIKDTAGDILERGKSTVGQSRDKLAAAVDAGKSAYREAVSNFEQNAGEGV